MDGRVFEVGGVMMSVDEMQHAGVAERPELLKGLLRFLLRCNVRVAELW